MSSPIKRPLIILNMFCLSFILLFCSFPSAAFAKETPPTVSASAYVMMDANSGETLFAKNASKKVYPASTVKLMTALIALDELSLDKNIAVTATALSKVTPHTSVAGLKNGSVYSVKQLLQLTLMVSAADAACVLGSSIDGGYRAFIKKMNQKADALGLTHTSFDNVIGVDVGDNFNHTYTTAEEEAIITRYAMSFPQIRSIVAKPECSIKGVTYKSSNLFYQNQPYSRGLYTIIGSKTGTTNAAGHVFVATARDEEGHEVICAFWGNVSTKKTFQDIRKLLDYTFRSEQNGSLKLSNGFYDLRFRDSEKLIMRYASDGTLSGTEDGAFNPDSKVNVQDFINIINKIAGTKLKTQASGFMTVKNFAAVYSAAFPQKKNSTASKETGTAVNTKYISKKTLSANELSRISHLFDSGILPKTYDNNVDAFLTKEDMVFIGDALKRKLSKL